MEEIQQDTSILKEIIDSDYPLLDKFKEKAPGTFRHCMNVQVFAEAVASELDIDVALMRAASLYHDIGKMNNPEVFSENQNGHNMHDDLDPMMSYNLITRHVGDSVLTMLSIPNIPHELLDIISQHHGNTVLRYFYQKSGGTLDDIYRYKCKPPQTIEASVLMICDSVEATTRSLHNNGKLKDSDDRKDVIDNTIKRLVEDDQLDELRVGELKTIQKVLIKELDSLYHKREEYDADDKKAVKDSNKQDILKEEKKNGRKN